jgi:hypothetical protein
MVEGEREADADRLRVGRGREPRDAARAAGGSRAYSAARGPLMAIQRELKGIRSGIFNRHRMRVDF